METKFEEFEMSQKTNSQFQFYYGHCLFNFIQAFRKRYRLLHHRAINNIIIYLTTLDRIKYPKWAKNPKWAY